MTTFISDVLQDLKKSKTDLSNLIIVLPSKRAGVFFRHELSKITEQPVFSPEIFSIEAFVEELSQLQSINNVELLFEFYLVYKELTPSNKQDNFETFSKWAQILIQDFNEIDRYLIPEESIFDYLSAIQEINHWSLNENPTRLVSNYLDFWKRLKVYYKQFTNHLINKGFGYQGLIYREALENVQNYIENTSSKMHVFLGFNALNTAEETIIQELLQNNLAKIYWDIDEVFFNAKNHDASLFVTKYYDNWKYFKKNPFNWVSNHYSKAKEINVIGVPKNVGQSKYIGTILNNLKANNHTLDKTALVLGDESLLIPVLNSIPKHLTALNITMGLPLKTIPLATLFQHLFLIHKNPSSSFYYKDVLNILSHAFITPLLQIDDENQLNKITKTIKTNNLIYISIANLIKVSPTHKLLFETLFANWDNNVSKALEQCQSLILKIKNALTPNKKENILSLEYLFHFNSLFNELTQLNSQYAFLNSVSSLYSVYTELLNSETLDFKGEPLEGLQVMGMLESRVLDFETVIISSVNEGILPSGKTQNSFIPFDVKIENQLPTYKEKDAVYAYHFYRLIQRAKKVFVLYNTEVDALSGGEKSRFITQLELEDIHEINHKTVVPKVPKTENPLIEIPKTDSVLKSIETYAAKGFSPSALTSYVRNPIDFYFQKVLKIKEQDDIEETVAANTLGTIIHNTLEEFYEPFVGKNITVENIDSMKSNVDRTVTKYFKEVYKEGDISKGKNLIIFEIAKRYINNFLDLETTDLKNGNTIEIIAVELENRLELDIPELHFPIFLKGTVDRVDKRNGVVRIIDYKSGKVDKSKLEIINWEDITSDYDKYSKSFQVLSYALMMDVFNRFSEPIEVGVISFKNLNEGFLKFAKKDKPGAYAKKIESLNEELLSDFYNELKNLIIEICNPDIPFLEKEIK
ncbi:PD-(D/E)XK nuclease family protein [Hanstruepera ponticola]|uniref:PD-(D/E)XK nuclease family protein n=1 Tax=Hanstruepera ponticola TaxID=2042995 RepID=UPI00177F5ACB|nr:PD-(D/E)XK nuclease family protein [Hanstruepera ponticola]